MFTMIDQNNNGAIEYMEFIAATIRKQIFGNLNFEMMMDEGSVPYDAKGQRLQ